MTAALVAASLAACAEKAVDVGHNVAPTASTSASSTPTPPVDTTAAPPGDAGAPLLVVQNESILAFTASAGHVFWLGADYDPGPLPTPNAFHLRSCETTNCAATLSNTSISGGRISEVPNWIFVNDTRVFWQTVDEAQGGGVSFCSREDLQECGSLEGYGSFVPYTFAADDDRAYYGDRTDRGELACDIADCAGTISPLDYGTPPGSPQLGWRSIVLDGDYMYTASDSGNSNIVRGRKDGTGTLQIIAQDQPSIYALAVRNGQVYWSEHAALGRVYRCPTDGCDGDPAIAIADLNSPTALAVDDENVYAMTGDDNRVASKGQIVRCPVAGCTAPTIVVPEGASGNIFVDSDFLYYSGVVSCDTPPCPGGIVAVRK